MSYNFVKGGELMSSQFKIKVGMNIQEYRKRAEMTQKELADKLGLSEGNISKYEAGDIKRVDIEMVMQIASVLSCDPNDITGWKDEGSSIQFNIDEIDLIEKYRYISEYSPEGIEAVNFTLNRERRIAEQIKDGNIASNTDGESPSIPSRIIQYFQSVSAGTGQVIFDDVYSERITIPDIPKYRRVAYAVKVSGHSMEPLYQDGDMLLIEPTCSIDVGEIGIFNVDGQAYVKKLGKGELISLNTGYGNITFTDDSRCMGRVIDKFTSNKKGE